MKNTLASTIYPVVDKAHWVERLGRAGARLIQLRVKDLPADELEREIVAARDIAHRLDLDLVLNDYWQDAIRLGVNFIHLGQEDLDIADVGAIRAAGIRIGVSTHSESELERALTIQPDYVALGPIWPTKLKQMPWAPQGLERIREWRARIGSRPLVAIGGITLERAPHCIEAGADCAAAVSDFIKSPDPEGQVRAWLNATLP